MGLQRMCRGAAVLHWQAVPHVPKPAAQQLQQKRIACTRTPTHIKIGQRLQSISIMLSPSIFDFNNQLVNTQNLWIYLAVRPQG